MSGNVELIELVRKFRASESPEVAATIIKHVFPAIHLYILRRVGPEAVDDIRAETLIAISYNLYKVDLDATSARVWGLFFIITRRQIFKYFATKKTEPYVSVDTEELSQADAISALQDFEHSQNDAKELGQYVLTLVKQAAPDCFKLLWDRYIVGLDVDEIASDLKVNYSAAAQRIHRCKALAGSLMKKEGLHG